MARMVINDEEIELSAGETMLEAARRKGAHVWFVCDGRGLCQTCECRVLSGAEQLSPPPKIEIDSISSGRRGAGYRLACQALIAGDGAVSVISRAEELRRQAFEALSPPAGTGYADNLGRFARSTAEAAVDFVSSAPYAVAFIFGQLRDSPPTMQRMADYIRDSARLFGRLFTTLSR